MIIIINENSEWEPNSMQKKLYLYLSGSAFLVSFTDPNKQFFNVKFVLTFLKLGVNKTLKTWSVLET